MANTVHKVPGGYEWIVNRGGEYGFDECFECGDTILKGETVYFAGNGDGCPMCSLKCAEARRTQLADCAEPQARNLEFEHVAPDGRVLASAYIRRSEPRRVARVINGKARWVFEAEERLVFTGAPSGEHSIDLSVSNQARIQAHWQGYLEANGIV